MAKEFKNFDKLLARYKGELKLSADEERSIVQYDLFKRWEFHVDVWSVEAARYAVYAAEGFEEWQRFRVGLKGLSTRGKLMRLTSRYYAKVETAFDVGDIILGDIEKCRIDNYIGALKRGGLLDDNLCVKAVGGGS